MLQIRAFATTAQTVLKASGASADAKPAALRDVPAATISALEILLPTLPIDNLPAKVETLPLIKLMPNEPVLASVLEYVGGMVADLADSRQFDAETWETKALGNYIRFFVGGKEEAKAVSAKTLETFIEADKVRPCL